MLRGTIGKYADGVLTQADAATLLALKAGQRAMIAAKLDLAWPIDRYHASQVEGGRRMMAIIDGSA